MTFTFYIATCAHRATIKKTNYISVEQKNGSRHNVRENMYKIIKFHLCANFPSVFFFILVSSASVALYATTTTLMNVKVHELERTICNPLHHHHHNSKLEQHEA